MNYFKDKKTNTVYAYDNEQLAQVSRLTELEQHLKQIEPVYIGADNDLQLSLLEFNQSKKDVELEESKLASDDEDNLDEWNINHSKKINELELVVDEKKQAYEKRLAEFNQIEEDHYTLKNEYDAIPHAVFDIRENINVFKKMSEKEIKAHLNPPIPKDQLITQAEQQKQSLLAEANNAIAPLQDAIDLGMATEVEAASLQEWKKYRVLLNRVDTSTAPNIDWPQKPE
ncbi:tail fiber assembly protein [Providencia manganoxydans]|uniref:tail fiber assembly protein n=1 Tax=Providencia manganoxydans TaxID=2923283 RepID=UPI0032DA38C2